MTSAPRMLASAAQMLGFVVKRRAAKTEPLDDTDWMNLEGANELLALSLANEAAPLPFIPCYSASGTALMLRAILQRGSLASGDMEAIHAAATMLERARRRGEL